MESGARGQGVGVKDQQERIRALVAKFELLRTLDAPRAAMLERWVDRLIAGEPVEIIAAEAERVIGLMQRAPNIRH
jgi:hypothetical protein